MPVPVDPKIYHITHVHNLATIVADGGLLSDARMAQRGGPPTSIGMSAIKQRRLEELEVTCHSGTMVGEYVPFYFCPRSVMLYLLHRGNHPELNYKEGQGPIVHLEARMTNLIEWAKSNGVHWAFSLGNAGTRYAEFRKSVDQLSEIDWEAVVATDWRAPEVKEGKMAEFLVFGFVPLDVFDRVGARDAATREVAETALEDSAYSLRVDVIRDWYY